MSIISHSTHVNYNQSGLSQEKNDNKSTNVNLNLNKNKSLLNFNEHLMKFLNDLKIKYKISDDQRSVKEFESYYNSLLEKINSQQKPPANPNQPNSNTLASQNNENNTSINVFA